MASRWRYGPRSRSGDPAGGLKTARMPRQQEPSGETEDAAESLRELPRWMRLYFYGMHGVTLDVLLSSLHGVLNHRDPKLVGFSSPYLCIMHSLTHFALEKIYSQKRCFRGRPVVFHLVFYPSVYIGLQILIGNINTLTEQVRVVSGTQLAVHYILALYFAQVFHRGLSKLQYHPSSCPPRPQHQTRPGGQRSCTGASARSPRLCALPVLRHARLPGRGALHLCLQPRGEVRPDPERVHVPVVLPDVRELQLRGGEALPAPALQQRLGDMEEAPHLHLLHLHMGVLLGSGPEAVRRLLLGLLPLSSQLHGTHHPPVPARLGVPQSVSGRAVQCPAEDQVHRRC